MTAKESERKSVFDAKGSVLRLVQRYNFRKHNDELNFDCHRSELTNTF
jgi:hypothetical protein